jgi:hypothetical protein
LSRRKFAEAKKIRFNIETKISPDDPALAPDPVDFVKFVHADIKKAGLEQRVILQSFDWRTLTAMAKINPRIRLSALSNNPESDLPKVLELKNSGTPISIFSPDHTRLTEAVVTAAHAAKLEVIPWTANAPADWTRLIGWKVDGIITDHPQALVSFLKSKDPKAFSIEIPPPEAGTQTQKILKNPKVAAPPKKKPVADERFIKTISESHEDAQYPNRDYQKHQRQKQENTYK